MTRGTGTSSRRAVADGEAGGLVDDLPDICGRETEIAAAMARPATPAAIDLRSPRGGFAVALHMHQPLMPAGGDPTTAAIIGNLQWMSEHQDVGDNHNAPVLRWCYQRMGEFLPSLFTEGQQPRVLLDYSGTLLHGLCQMGAHEVVDALASITSPATRPPAVEWLGTTWGHAVAPSTPVQDFRLHVRAWQHHFASLFGMAALSRVRGFSPPELALPNHPDVAYEFVRTLRDCGYRWVLVREHSVETVDGGPVADPHVPHRLVCTSSEGRQADILAIVSTRDSDTELVGRLRPYYETLGLSPIDVEHGGVLMTEFPSRREVADSAFPVLRPVWQHLVWQRMSPGDGRLRLASVIADLAVRAPGFHMAGGSWTDDLSWVRGYEDVLIPMDRASSAFHERVAGGVMSTSDPRYRRALFHLLCAETSCYRHRGRGPWTGYAAEMARRAIEAAARATSSAHDA